MDSYRKWGLRSEIGESGSEKELFTLLRSKPQNDPLNISLAPKRPETAYSSRCGDPEKGKANFVFLPFWDLHMKIPAICMDLAPGGPNPCMHTKRLDNPANKHTSTKRLDTPAVEAALAADLFTATPDSPSKRPTRHETTHETQINRETLTTIPFPGSDFSGVALMFGAAQCQNVFAQVQPTFASQFRAPP